MRILVGKEKLTSINQSMYIGLRWMVDLLDVTFASLPIPPVSLVLATCWTQLTITITNNTIRTRYHSRWKFRARVSRQSVLMHMVYNTTTIESSTFPTTVSISWHLRLPTQLKRTPSGRPRTISSNMELADGARHNFVSKSRNIPYLAGLKIQSTSTSRSWKGANTQRTCYLHSLTGCWSSCPCRNCLLPLLWNP